MRRAGLALAMVSCLGLSGCLAGPKQLQRSVDDWDNKLYVQSPWIDGALHVIPFFPILTAFAGLGDFLVTNTAAFWFEDAWDGKGTAFKHLEVEPTDGEMRSLMIDDTDVLKVYGR